MKRLIMAMILPAALLAQSASASGSPGTAGLGYGQLYCSGFVTREAISRDNFVLGSKESPHADRFAGRDTLFLRGPALAPGTRYSLLRQVADPNREDSSPEQRARLASLGDMYEDVGWVTVESIVDGTAVASFDFSCGAAIPGDLVVPFVERPAIAYRSPEPPLGSFLPHAPTGPKTRILGAPDFLALLGTGTTVYTDLGSRQGVKPGDYLMITRGYAPEDLNRIDRASEGLPRGAEATAVNPAQVPRDADMLMPDRILGEMIVLNVSPESSTALITRVTSEVELGDVVRLENPDGSLAPVVASAETAPKDDPAAPTGSRIRRMFGFLRGKAELARDKAESYK